MDENNVTKKESEIEKVLSRLSSITDNCESVLETLVARLSSVCNKNSVNEGDKPGKEPEYSTVLAQEIDKIVSRLEKLCREINYLKSRIEL